MKVRVKVKFKVKVLGDVYMVSNVGQVGSEVLGQRLSQGLVKGWFKAWAKVWVKVKVNLKVTVSNHVWGTSSRFSLFKFFCWVGTGGARPYPRSIGNTHVL